MTQSSSEPTVQEMAKGGYYEGLRRLDSEFDFEVTIARPSSEAEALTFKRTKPRPEAADYELRVTMPSDAKLIEQEPLVELVDGIWRRRRP